MPYLALPVVLSFLLDLAHVPARSDRAKDVELLLLRQRLRLCERQASQARLSRWEKVQSWLLRPSPPHQARSCIVRRRMHLGRRT